MLIRMFVRAPIMMISALVMCVSISPKISLIFLIALIFLGGVMAFIVSHAFPIFDKMFKGYDKLNASVQENLTGIRVVKAYVREDHENKKFCDATDNLKKMSVHAERLVIMNQPVMQFTDPHESDDDLHGICYGDHGKLFCKAYCGSTG